MENIIICVGALLLAGLSYWLGWDDCKDCYEFSNAVDAMKKLVDKNDDSNC